MKCHNLDVCEYYLVHMRSYEYVYRKTWYVKLIHGVGKRASTFAPDAEDTLWRHISKTGGTTLFGATVFDFF